GPGPGPGPGPHSPGWERCEMCDNPRLYECSAFTKPFQAYLPLIV
uniref:Collagen IV NC1 domain-containing protein n=1 Tax=Steinernema glaseri TaxID=37863 RepID=A0A1I8AAJ6_9BILA